MYARRRPHDLFRSSTPFATRITIKMDPDCAICHAPASAGCDCESRGLDTAIRQAESRMMQTIYSDIRKWVKNHAQDYILQYFTHLANGRKAQHATNLERITDHAFRYYGGPPHPQEITQAQRDLKRGIDDDWSHSVQRYPEVLEYFYGLIELSFPPEDAREVQDPPLSALNGSRKVRRMSRQASHHGDRDRDRERGGSVLPDRELPRGKTPPPPPPPPPPLMYGMPPALTRAPPLPQSRTPGPGMRHSYGGPPLAPPPPPGSMFYPRY